MAAVSRTGYSISKTVFELPVRRSPSRERPDFAKLPSGADEHLGIEAHGEDPEMATEIKWAAIPCDELMNAVAVKIGKFVIGAFEEHLNGTAIRRDHVRGAPVSAAGHINQ